MDENMRAALLNKYYNEGELPRNYDGTATGSCWLASLKVGLTGVTSYLH